MTLALFDLDNTLLSGDSDHLFGEYLVQQNLVDNAEYSRQNDAFHQQYIEQTLDINQYIQFCTQPLQRLDQRQLDQLHRAFYHAQIAPIVRQQAVAAINDHKAKGHVTLILTATHEFISRPIAAKFAVDGILSTDLQRQNGRITGNIAGTPCFREGKVTRIKQWLAANPGHSLDDSYFYSDSFNDLPLLAAVKYPMVVTPDELLRAHALANQWPILDFS